jgi:hypothetical protein
MLDRRVRAPEDLLAVAGVPVLGVLTRDGARPAAFRLSLARQPGPGPGGPALLPAPGGRS